MEKNKSVYIAGDNVFSKTNSVCFPFDALWKLTECVIDDDGELVSFRGFEKPKKIHDGLVFKGQTTGSMSTFDVTWMPVAEIKKLAEN